ncbi:MAG: DUF6498-containing protein [Planctomycetota bacterium]
MSLRPSYWNAFAALLIANATTIVVFVFGWVSFSELLWSYWCQSVLIGVFNAFRMSALNHFSTEGFTSNGKRVAEDAAGKFSTVIFFIVHYGFFHVGYAVFLTAQYGGLPNVFASGIALTLVLVLLFLVCEILVVREQMRIDTLGKPNIGSMMFLPYLRIVPMHLTILFGGSIGSGAVIFLVLKLLADLFGHFVGERINTNAIKKGANPA